MMCIAFSCAGFGLALVNSQGNTYVSSMRDAPTKLGFLHAAYGEFACAFRKRGFLLSVC